ncbi:hypothetical protein [Oceanicoccus sp. KOV_DT_Chl]|uniref:hypothetical protein n=1 Tax=Oceanicoccus sp. KOV_DT_Chl TaxID=1904639 RepID=UPI000C7E768E|nr:hypothetical protein [Oceanicoccus sp. KOV_DT_Chl]
MIYVEEKDFSRQIQLLSFLAGSTELSICAWLYPESSASKLASFEVTENTKSLIPVTTYENGFQPNCTSLVPANESSINTFRSAHSELKKNCDSLALYKNSESSWLAATIGHEGMCLVQDDNLLNSLLQAGFSASSEAPSWW